MESPRQDVPLIATVNGIFHRRITAFGCSEIRGARLLLRPLADRAWPGIRQKSSHILRELRYFHRELSALRSIYNNL